jgi:subtilisin family serine protease
MFRMTRLHLIIYIGLVALSMFPLSVCAQRAALVKMSPTVRQICLSSNLSQSKAVNGSVSSPSPMVTAFVRADGDVDGLFAANGNRVYAAFDDIFIAAMPVANLMSIAADSRVKRIETARGTALHNATITSILNAAEVHEGRSLPQAYTGKGVVMGLMDVGFDLTNPNFYSRDMQDYRIRSFWDMLSTDTIGSLLPVGNDYTGSASILSYAHSRDAEITGHGTHTLGTAAGSGYGSAYSGLAFDSDICLVSNATSDDRQFIADDDIYKYTYATDALGFKYIFDYAESVGKPCVISFSEGSHQDLYGDDLLYYEVLNKLTGPGRILVASAGNNNLSPSYIHKQRGVASAGTFLDVWENQFYFIAQADRDFTARMVIYGSDRDTLTVSSAWLCQQPDSLAADTVTVDGNEYTFLYGAYPSCYDPDRLVVEYVVSGPDHMGRNQVCPFSVEFIGEDADIEVHKVVGNFVSRAVNPSLNQGECSHDIHSPASSPDVICVGATAYVTGYTTVAGKSMTYDYGTGGVKASFSSVGPTLDGRVKPDVMAPGANIISSASSYFFEANPQSSQIDDIVEQFDFGGRTYYWKADTGTSMSSPAVGGAIALWLQARPDLTREEIMDVFAHTCTRPEASLDYPNNRYGYGQIDVYRGLLYLLGIDGIDGLSLHQPEKVAFAVTGDSSFDVTFPSPLCRQAEVRVYNTSGLLLHTEVVAAGTGVAHVTLPPSVKGVVAVQVTGDSRQTTGSTLLRL